MSYERISNLTSIATMGYALIDIKEVLSIVILILSITNILWNMGYRIFKHVKEKRFEEISNEIENAKNELEKIEKEREE